MARNQASTGARSLRQWPLLIVLAGVAIGAGLAYLSDSSWRLGCLVIGASLGIGAVERIALRNRDAGLLQVRGKAFDVVMLIGGAVLIIALAIAVPEGRR